MAVYTSYHPTALQFTRYSARTSINCNAKCSAHGAFPCTRRTLTNGKPSPRISCQVVPPRESRRAQGQVKGKHCMAYTVSVGMTPTAPLLMRSTTGSSFQKSSPEGSTFTRSIPPSPLFARAGPTQSPEKEPLLYLQESGSRKRARALGDGGVP